MSLKVLSSIINKSDAKFDVGGMNERENTKFTHFV